MDFGIHVTLADDTTGTLFQITGSPRSIQVMKRHKSVLDIHASSHFEGRSHEHSYLTGADFGEELLLTGFGICLMNKGDLFSRDTSGNELFTDIIIDGEIGVIGSTVLLGKHFQSVKLRTVQISGGCFRRSLARRSFRCAEVTEHELGQLVPLSFVPNAEDIVHAHVDLTGRFVGQIRIDDTLIQTKLSAIGRNLEHVVGCGIYDTGVNLGGSFRQLLHHSLLNFRRLSHYIVVDGRRCRKVQLIGCFDIRSLFEEVHQLRQIEELRKASSSAIAGSFGRKLNGRGGLTKGGRPAVKMRQTLTLDGVMLQIAHHGVQLGHGVGNGSAGGKDHALAVGHLIDIAAFQQHIGGLLCIGSGKTCYVSHLCVEEKVLKAVCLVYIQTIHAQLLECDDIILAGGVLNLFQSGLQALLGTLKRLDGKPFSSACPQFGNTVLDLRNLFLQKPFLAFL